MSICTVQEAILNDIIIKYLYSRVEALYRNCIDLELDEFKKCVNIFIDEIDFRTKQILNFYGIKKESNMTERERELIAMLNRDLEKWKCDEHKGYGFDEKEYVLYIQANKMIDNYIESEDEL